MRISWFRSVRSPPVSNRTSWDDGRIDARTTAHLDPTLVRVMPGLSDSVRAAVAALGRATIPDLSYVSREPLDGRELAIADPPGVLASLPGGAISEAVWRAPDLFDHLWTGAAPRLFDRGMPLHQSLADDVAIHVQRDVRLVLHIGDLRTCTSFLQPLAGSTAGEVHLTRRGGQERMRHDGTGGAGVGHRSSAGGGNRARVRSRPRRCILHPA